MSQEQKVDWRIVGLVILCVRFVQGWIFWGGGSRRFIYAPQKLDPYASQWMANKLQSAMPGALLDVGQAISFLLHHFYLLYAAIILFSLVELVSGVALIFGFFTRAAGFISVLLSISLMLIFGWEGSTCLDEWTMAVSNLAMGFTLVLSGAPIYSIDNWFMRRYPRLIERRWFLLLASGQCSFKTLKRAAIACALFTIIFTLGTYNYYRGAILTHYHAGPISAVNHHITLSEGQLKADGSVIFTAYVDAGNTAIPSNILKIELADNKGSIIETWTSDNLSHLPMENINNDYLYNRIITGPFGLEAPVSARAIITLLPPVTNVHLQSGKYKLDVYTVGGHVWKLDLNLP
jgi:thiosulfate dehydrogenase (quinone)